MVGGRLVNPIAKKPIARANCNPPVADIVGGAVVPYRGYLAAFLLPLIRGQYALHAA